MRPEGTQRSVHNNQQRQRAQTISSEKSIQLGENDLAMQTLLVKCQGFVNDKKARDEMIKTLKAQTKENVLASKGSIIKKKARLQVEVARKKMLIKADSKGLEFEQKLEQEDKRAMQRTGRTVCKCMTESGRWALGSISQNNNDREDEIYNMI